MAESDLSTSPIPQARETFTRSKQEHPHIRLWTNRPGFTEVLLLQHGALGQTGLVSFNPWFPLFWGCFLQLSLKELTTHILRHFCYTCVRHWCALSASACPWTCVRVFSCPSHCPCHTGPSAAGLFAGWTAQVKVSPPLMWPTGCHVNTPTAGRVCGLLLACTRLSKQSVACAHHLICTHKWTDSTVYLCRRTHIYSHTLRPPPWCRLTVRFIAANTPSCKGRAAAS